MIEVVPIFVGPFSFNYRATTKKYRFHGTSTRNYEHEQCLCEPVVEILRHETPSTFGYECREICCHDNMPSRWDVFPERPDDLEPSY